MVDSWSFNNPVRIYFGRGQRQRLCAELAGKELLVISTLRGRQQIEHDDLLHPLLKSGRLHWVDNVETNPGLNALQAEADHLRRVSFDAVLACGGGSVIDTAKVLALALNRELEENSIKDLISNPALHASLQPKPLYVLPTTAGTGSEVTPFATIWDYEYRKKLSLAGPDMFPEAAYIDSELTDSVPDEVTISTGLDAINQAAESIWNKNSNPITVRHAIRAIKLGMGALPRLIESQLQCAQLRDQMAEASLLAGLSISCTRTALCHSISYPLTAHFGVPHGLACAFSMPAVSKLNIEYVHARWGTLCDDWSISDLLGELKSLNSSLRVRELVKAKVPDFDALVKLTSEMITPGRAENNLAPVDQPTLLRILDESWNQI